MKCLLYLSGVACLQVRVYVKPAVIRGAAECRANERSLFSSKSSTMYRALSNFTGQSTFMDTL